MSIPSITDLSPSIGLSSVLNGKINQPPMFDQRLNPIIEKFLNRDLANLVVEYATSNELEDLIKNGHVTRLAMILTLGNTSFLTKPAVYSCVVAAIFGESEILRWLLSSNILIKEIADNQALKEHLYRNICHCSKEFNQKHLLIIFRNILLQGSNINSPGILKRILSLINQKDQQTNETIRKQLILTHHYVQLAHHLESFVDPYGDYDRNFDGLEYITFTGWEIFILKRNGFFTFDSPESGFTSLDKLIEKRDQCKYHLHKNHLKTVIQLLKSPPTTKWVPTHRNDMSDYLEYECLFPIIEHDPQLLNVHEPLYELINAQTFSLFAKEAIQHPDISNKDLYNACLKDYVLHKFDYLHDSMRIFGKSVYPMVYENPFTDRV